MSDKDTINAVLDVLINIRQKGGTIKSIPNSVRPSTPDEGYQIQEALTKRLGQRVVGWKIAATNKRAQTLIGSDEPFAGPLFPTMLRKSPATLPSNNFNMRMVEGEFAFKMSTDLPARSTAYSRHEVETAIASVHPAIEVADSRYSDWLSVGLPSLIADGAVSGAFIYGSGISDWRDCDLIKTKVKMIVNQEEVGCGTGAGALGDPVLSLMWLVNKQRELGGGTKAGQIITTGTCTGNYQAPPSANVQAVFSGLGSVQLQFT